MGVPRPHSTSNATDLDAEVDRLLNSGATLVGRRGDENFRWVMLADPAGNDFCVAEAAESAAELG
ncbi:MAG: VOC family protein [Nocardioides sp.]